MSEQSLRCLHVFITSLQILNRMRSVIPLPELPAEESMMEEQEGDGLGPMRAAGLKPKAKISERWLDLGFATASLPR